MIVFTHPVANSVLESADSSTRSTWKTTSYAGAVELRISQFQNSSWEKELNLSMYELRVCIQFNTIEILLGPKFLFRRVLPLPQSLEYLEVGGSPTLKVSIQFNTIKIKLIGTHSGLEFQIWWAHPHLSLIHISEPTRPY